MFGPPVIESAKNRPLTRLMDERSKNKDMSVIASSKRQLRPKSSLSLGGETTLDKPNMVGKKLSYKNQSNFIITDRAPIVKPKVVVKETRHNKVTTGKNNFLSFMANNGAEMKTMD